MELNKFSGRILLVIPPLLQPNAPYPATTVLQGYLKSKGVECSQFDLGIEFLDSLFSKQGLESIFREAGSSGLKLTPTVKGMVLQKERYIKAIDNVKTFLKNPTPDLAHLIVNHHWLPSKSA